MINLSLFSYICLLSLIFLAGFVDSIAGGGGLISLTSYYAIGLPPLYALGNNKFSSTFGTLFALGVYKKNNSVNFKVGFFTAIFAFCGSLLGSKLAILYSDIYLKYILLITIPILTILTLRHKDVKNVNGYSGSKLYIICALLGLIIGTYDGFYGPGTGMLLTFAFTQFAGFSILDSCGNTKLVNLSSNIAALISFMINGNIIYTIGLPCLIASILGNIAGSKIAIKGGGKIVKPMMVVVLLLLFIKVIVSFF